MISKNEYEEEAIYLSKVLEKLSKDLFVLQGKISQAGTSVRDMLSYISSHFYDMDPAERSSAKSLLSDEDANHYYLLLRENIVKRQIKSPYFGRIDFKADDEQASNRYYIGIGNVESDLAAVPFVCDWRAPVSSMYYDFEVGKAVYTAPMGEISGEISQKRQFKIKESNLMYCFDSNLTIGDEILQEVLSEKTDSKMKNIVSTIQKEQNKIIRSDINKSLIVQGVAGSGKTSIALHKVAFLLYKYKESIKAGNILIISPNKIFSDYISNVLPELGETNILETTFSEIAKDELKGIAVFEERTDMLDDLITCASTRIDDVKTKTSLKFFKELNHYLYNDVVMLFNPTDIVVGEKKIPKEKILELYNKRYGEKEISLRIEWIAEYVSDELESENKSHVGITKRIKKVLYNMFSNNKILDIYEKFLIKQGLKFEFSKTGVIKYEDVAPILYIKYFLLGISRDKKIKYLLIDEMQDYSPIEFFIFGKIYNCPKIILGDVYQSIEKEHSVAYLKDIKETLGEDCDILTLNKSYRSTIEISRFAQKIIDLKGAENVSRNGQEPEIIRAESDADFTDKLILELKAWKNKAYNRCAVICKTDDEAKTIYEHIKDHLECSLMTKKNTQIEFGIIITTSALSKGLEFDGAIIPNVNALYYKTEIDKNILYISCTRALHELKLIYTNNLSNLIKIEGN